MENHDDLYRSLFLSVSKDLREFLNSLFIPDSLMPSGRMKKILLAAIVSIFGLVP